MRAAMSMLWVAMITARPEARTSWVSAWNTWSEVRGSRFPVGSSASRMRGQRDRLAGPDGKLGVLQDFERGVALHVMPMDALQIEDRRIVLRGRRDARCCGRGGVIHSAAPRPDRAGPRAMTDKASPAA